MRLFGGVFPDENGRNQAATVASALRELLHGKGRWVKPEKLHITLKFFGDEASVEDAAEQIERAVQDAKAFTLSLDSISAFPNPSRGRILFLAASEDEALVSLCRRLDESDRDPKPHLTLARFERPVRVPQVDFEPIEYPVTELLLVQSVLSGPDAGYHVLRRWPLR
ncbi:MAG: RNA 2',3'-cyclic phosphodiesterase [Fimbriimonadales bacterium]|nr:RNA 2',3'-cyclic phosphodiesterase [Armatimonadota bacterium]MBV6503807.1 RNA 2',3'-cyclic phosphodiesterase [Fimbriimonadales bacterium]NOG93896.1 RNA 2',3'-cyclic phosphodiesterase [Armatimonadota bacterium]